MNSRTLILLAVMLVVGVAMVGDQFGLLSFLDEGASTHEKEMDRVALQIEKADEIIRDGMLADDMLKSLENRSLPYDPEMARSAYQNWLTKLVASNDLAQSSVDVAMPISVTITENGKKKEAYKRYAFTVNGAGRLEQATRFLFDFYQGGHLQKINSLSLTPASGGQFSMTITGEAIGVPTCDRKSELSTASAMRPEQDDFDVYAKIVRRNIFSREAGETLKWVKLSSVTFDKTGAPEAWFKVGRQQATKKMQRGEKLELSVHAIEVIDIQPRSVLLNVDGQIVDVPQGANIHEQMSAVGIAAG